jgi:uncharacterized protein YdhG (YjbR/CyaY superfamily)
MQRLASDKPIVTIDDYIALQPEEFRPMLAQLRAIVLSIVPEAKESISYQVPCFKYIYMLVGIGVSKKYCSFYTMSPSLTKALKEDLKGFRVSGSTIHFVPQEPLPVPLIEKIIKARVKENRDKSFSKTK